MEIRLIISPDGFITAPISQSSYELGKDRFHCHAIKNLNQKLSSAKSYEIVML